MGNCATCMYASMLTTNDGKLALDVRQCRRFPPKPILRITARGPEENYVWPVLRSDLWCGEFKIRPGTVDVPVPAAAHPEQQAD